MKIILGDCNAKIGRENIYKNVTGGKSKHEISNENGKLLINFAMEQNLKIMSTYFDRKNIYKTTWISPDGNTANQIDHVIIETKHANSVQNIRTYRGADCNTDHFMVVANIRQEIPKQQKRKQNVIKRYKTDILKDDKVKEQLNYEITSRLSNKMEVEDINQEWMQIQTVITEVAERIMKRTNKVKDKDWFDIECRQEIENRNKAKIQKNILNTTETRKNYEQARKKVKQICRKKKRDYWEMKLQIMENRIVNRH